MPNSNFPLPTIGCAVGRLESEIGTAALMIIDLHKAEPEELSSLKLVMDNISGNFPSLSSFPISMK